MNLKEEWVAERAKVLWKGSTALLVRCAEDQSVKILDLDSVKDLAKRVAEAEWEARAWDSKEANLAWPPTFSAAGLGPMTETQAAGGNVMIVDEDFAETTKGHVGVREDGTSPLAGESRNRVFYGNEFNAMESGPMEEPDPAVTKLKADIMERWIGMIGGEVWYNGPGGDKYAKSHGKALAAVLDDVVHGGRVRGSNPHGISTSSGWFIYEEILPQVLDHFFQKNADYGDNHREGLGARAEFVGIHRKVKKLEKALWNRDNMNGEGVEEMLTDLIGQCLITLDLLAQEQR